MLRVLVLPSAIYITPYTKFAVPAIEKSLSVYDVVAKYYTSKLYSFEIEDPVKKTGVLKIPRGYGLDTVEAAIQQMGLQYTVVDYTSRYAEPRRINLIMKKEPRNEVQRNSLAFLKRPDRQLFLCLDVGTGKTYCGVNRAVTSGMATMVISYSLSNQWLEKILEYTNAVNGKDVIMISSSNYLERCVCGIEKQKAAIYLVSISTLDSYRKLHGPESLQKVVDNLGIGIKIFDEAHVRFLQFNELDLNMQVFQTIYLSATPGRSNYNENKVFNKMYSRVETFGSFTSKMNNFYCIRYVTIDSHSTAKDRVGLKTVRGFSSLKYIDWLFTKYHNEMCEMMMYYLKPILQEDSTGKVLIVIDWLKYLMSVKKYFEENYPEFSCGAFCAIEHDKSIRQKELDKRIILGTIGSMQNGRDIANLRAVFCCTQFSSSIVARQLLGRLRKIPDKTVHYFDMADRSVPDTMSERFRRNQVFESKANGLIKTDDIDLDRF